MFVHWEERDEAFLSKDHFRILKFCNKYNITLPLHCPEHTKIMKYYILYLIAMGTKELFGKSIVPYDLMVKTQENIHKYKYLKVTYLKNKKYVEKYIAAEKEGYLLRNLPLDDMTTTSEEIIGNLCINDVLYVVDENLKLY